MKKLLTLVIAMLFLPMVIAQQFRPGTDFRVNQSYGSEDIGYNMIFQNDGNLVVYHNGNAIWNSNTQGSGSRAAFQTDGNLVIYNRAGAAVFSSNTNNRGARVLKLQDDGNLVIYDGRNRPLWASMGDRGSMNNNNDDDAGVRGEIIAGYTFPRAQKLFSSNRAYYLEFQRDGNMVFYRTGSPRPLWSSNTDGRGARAGFQDDGNLVIYDGRGNVVFTTDTQGRGNNLSVQNDGNVVIYDTRGNPVWSSNK